MRFLKKLNSKTMVVSLPALALASALPAGAVTFNATDDVEASIYGYVRANVSYDIDENIAGNTTGTGNFGALNKDDDADTIDGHFNIDANQSRWGIKVKHASGVLVNIESDFATSTGAPRIRHAYGSYNGILAGQTWSNFGSFVGTTSTLDFNGLAGQAGWNSRLGQVRYTAGKFSVAVEDPRSGIVGGSKRDATPALTAKFESKGDVSFAVGGVVRQLTHDTGADDDSTVGFGAMAAGKIKLGDGVSIQGDVNFHDGTVSYIYLAPAYDAYLKNGSLETISGLSGTLGVSVGAGEGTFNASAGYIKLDLDDAVDDGALSATADESRLNAFINYQWKPMKELMYGFELGYYKAESQNGDDGDAKRLLFAAQYSF
jgi:hypothetical protein